VNKRKLTAILLLVLGLIFSQELLAQTRPTQNLPNRAPQNVPNRQGQDTIRNQNGRIIDDTTRTIYGPKTTLQLYERDILEGTYREQRIDTSIQNMQSERYWYQDTAYYQHLGNVGTAAQPILYQKPNQLGVRYGRNSFNRYAYDPEKINYYDTRSPYSHLYYVQGQRGETVFEAIYARNITPKWNAGVAYQILTADKQIGANPFQRGNGMVNSQGVKAFTHYRSANNKYNLFANYIHLNHEQIETGGIRPRPGDTRDSLFRYEADLTWLDQAVTNEVRNNFHLTHILKLFKENLKVYHTLDWRKQRNVFQDSSIPRTIEGGGVRILFYPEILFDSTRTDDQSFYRELQNEFGITGNNRVSFFKAYIKQRSSKIEYEAFGPGAPAVTNAYDNNITQLLVGGQFRLNLLNRIQLFGDGEVQLIKDYRLQAAAKLFGFEFALSRISQSPSLFESRFLSNHFEWNNDFENLAVDQARFSYKGKLGKRQYLKLNTSYSIINNYIFLNQDAVPQQLGGNQYLYEAQLAHHIRFGGFHFENFVAYTNTEKSEFIRIPEWLVNSKVYYQGIIFKGALFGQIGVEAYMPTGYLADAYMPVTQQFYIQNRFNLPTYPVVDVFLNADIKTLNVFVKMSHANYELQERGYFVTPFYPGLRRSFTFGVKWMFFD
jgi:hypothetical protein